jgi:hypothetical protein
MPSHESLADGALYVDPRPDMDPALASLLKALQGKLRDIVSECATLADATTTTEQERTYSSDVDDARRAVVTCTKNASEWFQNERARILASTMSADDKTETSSRLDDDVRDMVFEAKRKIERAMETLPQKRST